MGLFSRAPQWQPEEDTPDQEAYDSAAMDKLGLGWFLNGVLGDISAERTAAMRKKIAEKRAWANALSDPKWRRAFVRWLDYADYCADRADRYRKERPAWNARCAEMDRERRAVNEAKRNLPPVR